MLLFNAKPCAFMVEVLPLNNNNINNITFIPIVLYLLITSVFNNTLFCSFIIDLPVMVYGMMRQVYLSIKLLRNGFPKLTVQSY